MFGKYLATGTSIGRLCAHIVCHHNSLLSPLLHYLIRLSIFFPPASHLQPFWYCLHFHPLHVSSSSGQLVFQDALSQATLLGRSSMGGAWVESESTDWTLSHRTGALAGHPPSASDGRGRWESQNQPHFFARLCYWRYESQLWHVIALTILNSFPASFSLFCHLFVTVVANLFLLNCSSQLMSSLQWNLTRLEISWPLGIKVAEWSSSRGRPRSVSSDKIEKNGPNSECWKIHNILCSLKCCKFNTVSCQINTFAFPLPMHNLVHFSLKANQRRWERRWTRGSTMSTALSRAMNQTLTTWRVWRLKKRSTRSDGCHSRTLHISCSQPMVR